MKADNRVVIPNCMNETGSAEFYTHGTLENRGIPHENPPVHILARY